MTPTKTAAAPIEEPPPKSQTTMTTLSRKPPDDKPTLLGRFLGDDDLAEHWRRGRDVRERERLRAAVARDVRAGLGTFPPATTSTSSAPPAPRPGALDELILSIVREVLAAELPVALAALEKRKTA